MSRELRKKDLICPDCKSSDLECHFDGSETWLMCNCGKDFLWGSGDFVDEILEILNDFAG